MRKDSNLMTAAEVQCAELDGTNLGRPSNLNIKKARGLMRAGREASRHLYTDWPHDFVLVGSDNDRVFYRDLSMEQWSYGFMSIIEKEVHPIIKQNMISHLKNLYMDAILYGFKRTKSVHGKVLTEIEDGWLTWLDAERITETRKTYMQRPLTLDDYREQQREEAAAATRRYETHDGYGYKYYENKHYETEEKPRKRSSPRTKKLSYKTYIF
jgi:hypothetical protein